MIIKAKVSQRKRIMIGVPLTGVVRAEWAMARYGQVIPCNWNQADYVMWIDQYSPLGFVVADARNVVVQKFLEEGFEWLFFLDHDVVIPPFTILRFNELMLKETVPVFGGLYFTRSVPSEPLVYRGRGNSYYTKWKMGEDVWVDGIHMGCTMIHKSVLRAIYDESEPYVVGTTQGTHKVRRVFETPSKVEWDPEKQGWNSMSGTEDLNWCQKIIEKGILEKSGWKKIAKRKFPFLVKTEVFCKHIELDGTQYPSRGEERFFERK